MRPGQYGGHSSRLRDKGGTGRDQSSILGHASRDRDRPRRALRITAEIQHTARRGDGTRRRKAIAPPGKHQRTVGERRPARVRVRATQSHRARPVFHETLCPGQHGAHCSRVRDKGGAGGGQCPVLDDPTSQGDRAGSALRITAQVQHTTRRGDGTRRRKAIAPSSEQQGTFRERRPAGVRVRAAQSHRTRPRLHQTLRPGQHRAHCSRVRDKHRPHRGQRPVLNHAAIQRDRARRALAVATKIQHAACRVDGTARRQPIAASAQQQRACAHRRAASVRVRRRQRRRAHPALHQTLRPSQHGAHRPELRDKCRTRGEQGSILRQASRDRDRPRGTLRVATKVQHAAGCRDRTARGQPIAASAQQQRTRAHRRTASVSIHRRQRCGTRPALHETLRPGQHGGDRPRLRHKRRPSRNQRSVLNHPATQRDRARRTLIVQSQIQHAAGCGNGAACRKSIATATQ